MLSTKSLAGTVLMVAGVLPKTRVSYMFIISGIRKKISDIVDVLGNPPMPFICSCYN
jgi:hypothetical protein